MPHHRLVTVGRHDSHVDEIILARNEETGEVEHKLSLHDIYEIPEDLLGAAHDLAGKVGLRVIEADAPADDDSEFQEPGADAASGSPIIKRTADSTSEIDQQKMAARASQQDTASDTVNAPTTGVPGVAGGTGSNIPTNTP